MDSKFSGGVGAFFLFCIWAPILAAISFGLATPFIVCTVIRWICNNSIIGGKSYKFTGTAGGLFGRWILWYLLSIITIGIYSFWMTRNQIRWVIENIDTVNEEAVETEKSKKYFSIYRLGQYRAKVIKDVHGKQSMESNQIFQIQIDEIITVIGISYMYDKKYNWCLVKNNEGVQGWCSSENLDWI